MREYLSIRDVATMFGVERKTVRRWIEKGVIPTIELDNDVFVPRIALSGLTHTPKGLLRDGKTLGEQKVIYDKAAREYEKSTDFLRSCTEVNYHLKKYREDVRHIVAEMFRLIRYEPYISPRGGDIITLLLDGKDAKIIANHYGIEPHDVESVIQRELQKVRDAARDYEAMKDQRDFYKSMSARLAANKQSAWEQIVTLHEGERASALCRKLVNCPLSVRALNCCKREKIITLGDLVAYDRRDMLKMRNLGRTTIQEFDKLIKSAGLAWGTKYVFSQSDNNPKEKNDESV